MAIEFFCPNAFEKYQSCLEWWGHAKDMVHEIFRFNPQSFQFFPSSLSSLVWNSGNVAEICGDMAEIWLRGRQVVAQKGIGVGGLRVDLKGKQLNGLAGVEVCLQTSELSGRPQGVQYQGGIGVITGMEAWRWAQLGGSRALDSVPGLFWRLLESARDTRSVKDMV
ncbi:uncharacterized protein EI90DRAFT_3013812 [Cantharellus anzutake]|uniref:uncharacterized protein n=1 Tax=Cantharellus anzutake TaxID=1750568 RepID=UPI0019069C61|nr:uncharacterized protein EI90DRAFT_3013812 [Cantharellus anzutake]KAF8337645.1 hypothetical protein EI90DRAFT_3013812 [Cantharellus anzutake]